MEVFKRAHDVRCRPAGEVSRPAMARRTVYGISDFDVIRGFCREASAIRVVY